MKTLSDFKQQVAEKKGFNKWYKLLDSVEWENVPDLCDEAAELYADYRAKEAREEGIKVGVTLGKGCKQDNLIKQAWNEALHWAAENAEVNNDPYGSKIWVDKQSILRGLKP